MRRRLGDRVEVVEVIVEMDGDVEYVQKGVGVSGGGRMKERWKR